MKHQDLIPHLFRTEFSRITAVLCKFLGIEHLEAAEDIASDTFLAAFENWPYSGIPANPQAWLYTVAKNKARNYIHRHDLFKRKIQVHLEKHAPVSAEPDIDLSDKNIADSQLQMMFAICHPAISVEAQVGLALRVLCGFGIEEIANAFLTNKETINKRLTRAREKLRTANLPIELPGETGIHERLDTVLTTLYLLFNEGYYSESQDMVVRNELCLEAMRLNYLLINNLSTDLPNVNALMALMCFHCSRFDARKDKNGTQILYDEQDESLWDMQLIAKGAYYLQRATTGSVLSKYHLEASIAWWHTRKNQDAEKWENILQIHNHLLVLEYSPVAALNRTYALSKVKGKAAAIPVAEQLNLVNNHYYYMLLGYLYSESNSEKSSQHYEKAYQMARTVADKATILKAMQQGFNTTQ